MGGKKCQKKKKKSISALSISPTLAFEECPGSMSRESRGPRLWHGWRDVHSVTADGAGLARKPGASLVSATHFVPLNPSSVKSEGPVSVEGERECRSALRPAVVPPPNAVAEAGILNKFFGVGGFYLFSLSPFQLFLKLDFNVRACC